MVGSLVGSSVGVCDGMNDGRSVVGGSVVGCSVGVTVGSAVGGSVGLSAVWAFVSQVNLGILWVGTDQWVGRVVTSALVTGSVGMVGMQGHVSMLVSESVNTSNVHRGWIHPRRWACLTHVP